MTDTPHSDIPYATGEDARFVHQTDGGFLSVERNDAGEITNVVRLMNVDDRTCLFSEADVEALSTRLTKQEKADFPGLDVDPKGWKSYHADKRLNGDTYVGMNDKGEYLTEPEGPGAFIWQDDPKKAFLFSEQEMEIGKDSNPGVQFELYSQLELYATGMKEEENGDFTGTDVPEEIVEYGLDLKVRYPLTLEVHDVIAEINSIPDLAQLEKKVTDLLRLFPGASEESDHDLSFGPCMESNDELGFSL